LLAAAGCPSLVLFSRDSDPARCVPRAPPGAPVVRVLRRLDLAALTPAEVIADVMAWPPNMTTGLPTAENDTAQAASPAPAKAATA